MLMQQEMTIQPDAPVNRLACLASRFCNLRVPLKDDAVTDQCTVIAMILELDAELAAWATQLPRGWEYAIIDTPDRTEGVYERSYHVYLDFWHATIWNNYRCVRILLNEMLLDKLDHLNISTYTPVFRSVTLQTHRHRSCATVSRLVSDICASVPFHLTHAYLQPAPAAAGFFLLWPLYVVGAMVDVPDAPRLWVIDRLEYIRCTTGIAMAKSLANVLRRANDSSPSEQRINYNLWSYENVDDEHDEEAGESEGWKRFLGTPGKYN